MANRHKVSCKKSGGGVAPKHDGKKEAYTGKGSHVEKEAEEKARGGKAEHKAEGKKGHKRLDKRARGGGIKHGSGKDMTSSPFSAAHHAGGPAATNFGGKTHSGK